MSEFEELRDAIRDVLRKQCSLAKVREFVEGDRRPEAALWRHAAELGWIGLALPEQHGGSGLGIAALAVLYQELGRHLAPIALMPTLLCAQALAMAASGPQQARYLRAIMAGECVATVSSLSDALDGKVVAVRKHGAAWRLAGRVSGLLCGADAGLLVLFARDEDGALCAVLVEPARDGVELVDQKSGDPTRTLCAASLDGIELAADRRLAIPDVEALLQRLLMHASIGLACDSAGGSAEIFDLTIDYLKTRQQFGRAIGSFQALKHRCADLRTLLEASHASVGQAVRVAGEDLVRDHANGATCAAMAKFFACDVHARIAADAIQMHGGIGFTWEHHCHLFLKRAKLNQQLHGGPEWQKDRIARQLVRPAGVA